MDIYALILASVAIILIWMILRPKHNRDSNEPKPLSPQQHIYAGVGVLPCANACQTARSSKTKAYLLKESPQLPLAGCDKYAECTCHFIHLNDRRHQEDRRAMTIVMKDIYHGMERRSTQRFGRRSTDYIEIGA